MSALLVPLDFWCGPELREFSMAVQRCPCTPLSDRPITHLRQLHVFCISASKRLYFGRAFVLPRISPLRAKSRNLPICTLSTLAKQLTSSLSGTCRRLCVDKRMCWSAISKCQAMDLEHPRGIGLDRNGFVMHTRCHWIYPHFLSNWDYFIAHSQNL
jgi:hypothetical protein